MPGRERVGARSVRAKRRLTGRRTLLSPRTPRRWCLPLGYMSRAADHRCGGRGGPARLLERGRHRRLRAAELRRPPPADDGRQHPDRLARHAGAVPGDRDRPARAAHAGADRPGRPRTTSWSASRRPGSAGSPRTTAPPCCTRATSPSTTRTRPYELRFDGDFQQYVLMLPGPTLRSQLGEAPRLTARRVAGASGAGHLMIEMIRTLAADIAVLEPAAAAAVAQGVEHIVVAGLSSLADRPIPEPSLAARRAEVKAAALSPTGRSGAEHRRAGRATAHLGEHAAPGVRRRAGLDHRVDLGPAARRDPAPTSATRRCGTARSVTWPSAGGSLTRHISAGRSRPGSA